MRSSCNHKVNGMTAQDRTNGCIFVVGILRPRRALRGMARRPLQCPSCAPSEVGGLPHRPSPSSAMRGRGHAMLRSRRRYLPAYPKPGIVRRSVMSGVIGRIPVAPGGPTGHDRSASLIVRKTDFGRTDAQRVSTPAAVDGRYRSQGGRCRIRCRTSSRSMRRTSAERPPSGSQPSGWKRPEVRGLPPAAPALGIRRSLRSRT